MEARENETLVDIILDNMMDEIEDPSRRSMHPSVTDLIYCLTKNWRNAREGNRRVESTQTKLFFATGLGLEKVMLGKSQTPWGVEHGGVYGHIDDVRDDVLWEFKSTRARFKSLDNYSEAWFKQIKSYLYMMGLNKANLIVLHITPPTMLKAWDLEFSQEELLEHWMWMMERKAVWEVAEMEGMAPEPYKYNIADWECKDCVYRLLCDRGIQE